MKNLRTRRNPNAKRFAAVDSAYRRSMRARGQRFGAHEHVIPPPDNVPELATGFPALVSRHPRKQCEKCPWKVTTDPNDIPNGYEVGKHRALSSTIADPGTISPGPLHAMACHETPRGKELPCVGWLVHQLGPGNNITLRLRISLGGLDANVLTVGPQHECFEDTLPITRARP